MTDALGQCLLSDEELLKLVFIGKEHWATLPDPFPSWSEAA